MFAAQRDITVIAANLCLCPFEHRAAMLVDAQIHRRFAAAFAHALELDE